MTLKQAWRKRYPEVAKYADPHPMFQGGFETARQVDGEALRLADQKTAPRSAGEYGPRKDRWTLYICVECEAQWGGTKSEQHKSNCFAGVYRAAREGRTDDAS